MAPFSEPERTKIRNRNQLKVSDIFAQQSLFFYKKNVTVKVSQLTLFTLGTAGKKCHYDFVHALVMCLEQAL